MSSREDPRSELDQHREDRDRPGESLLPDLNHIQERVELLEEAARKIRAGEANQMRKVLVELENVVRVATNVEAALSAELSSSDRVSVATARAGRDSLRDALARLDSIRRP